MGSPSAILRLAGHENSGSDDAALQLRSSATPARCLLPLASYPRELPGNRSQRRLWDARIRREPVPAILKKGTERRSRNVCSPKLGPGRTGARIQSLLAAVVDDNRQARRILSTISPKSPPGRCAAARSRGPRGRAAPTKNRSEAASRKRPSPLESPIAAVRRPEIPSSAAGPRRPEQCPPARDPCRENARVRAHGRTTSRRTAK